MTSFLFYRYWLIITLYAAVMFVMIAALSVVTHFEVLEFNVFSIGEFLFNVPYLWLQVGSYFICCSLLFIYYWSKN